MKGIGHDKKRKLNDMGIRTVKDLLEAYDAGKGKTLIASVKSVVEAFKEKLAMLPYTVCVCSIPQFVVGIDYSPKETSS